MRVSQRSQSDGHVHDPRLKQSHNLKLKQLRQVSQHRHPQGQPSQVPSQPPRRRHGDREQPRLSR